MDVSHPVIDRFVDGLHVIVFPSCLSVDTEIYRRDPVHPERFKIVKKDAGLPGYGRAALIRNLLCSLKEKKPRVNSF